MTSFTAEQRILIYLYLHPVSDNGYDGKEECTVNKISEAVRCSRAHTSMLLNRLEDMHYVGRLKLRVGRCRVNNWYLNVPGMILGGTYYSEMAMMGFEDLESYYLGADRGVEA